MWGNASKSYLSPLFRSQKKAIRRISHAGWLDHTNNLFKNLKILKLEDLTILESVKFVKKEISKNTSSYFIRRRNLHDMRLRRNQRSLLQLPVPRSERAKKFITYNAAKIWNELPPQFYQINNPTTFKIKMKKYLLNQY